MELPRQYRWLLDEPGPRILTVALRTYGTQEGPGNTNNPEIMRWAREVGLERIYMSDSTAWCGLWMAYVAGEAGWDYAPRGNALWARNWLFWGNPSEVQMLGDVLVFERSAGGHVGLYVGEDPEAFHVLGGNQSDKVMIKRISKGRFLGSRRCPWRISRPDNVRRVHLAASGSLSTNEA